MTTTKSTDPSLPDVRILARRANWTLRNLLHAKAEFEVAINDLADETLRADSSAPMPNSQVQLLALFREMDNYEQAVSEQIQEQIVG